MFLWLLHMLLSIVWLVGRSWCWWLSTIYILRICTIDPWIYISPKNLLSFVTNIPFYLIFRLDVSVAFCVWHCRFDYWYEFVNSLPFFFRFVFVHWLSHPIPWHTLRCVIAADIGGDFLCQWNWLGRTDEHVGLHHQGSQVRPRGVRPATTNDVVQIVVKIKSDNHNRKQMEQRTFDYSRQSSGRTRTEVNVTKVG